VKKYLKEKLEVENYTDTGEDTSLILKQVHIEVDSVMSGYHKYNQIKNTLYSNRQDISQLLKPEHVLLKRCMTPLIKAIKAFVDKASNRPAARRHFAVAQYLKQMRTAEVASVVLRSVINSLSWEKCTRTTLAKNIANNLRLHLTYKIFKEQFPHLLKHVLFRGKVRAKSKLDAVLIANNHYNIDEDEAAETFKLNLGIILIMLCINSTGIMRVETVTTFNGVLKKTAVVKPHPDLVKALEIAHDKCSVFKHTVPPLICKPLDWYDFDSGGYHTNFFAKRYPLVKLRGQTVRNKIEPNVSQNVYDAVNHLQHTAYQINNDVYEVMSQLVSTGGAIAGIPDMDISLKMPPKPWQTPEEKQYVKEHNKLLLKDYCDKRDAYEAEFQSNKTKRLSMQYKLDFARRYKDDSIYYPWFLDWRGRLYPFTSHVNPQIDDTGRALIKYKEGKIIGDSGITWLEIHGANTFGIDKLSYVDRVKFIQENTREILKCANDPYSFKLWTEADEPFKFLAFCYEYRDIHTKYNKPSLQHLTYLPVTVDGSCNGLQHYAALLRDERGGRAVNLIPAETPQDIYAEVAKEVDKLVREDAKNGNTEALKWIDKVNRSVVKPNVMTTVYGVTNFGMADQLIKVVTNKTREENREYLNLPEDFVESSRDNARSACKYLAKHVHTAIKTVSVAAVAGMDWFRSVAEILHETNSDVMWYSPVGFYVNQSYKKQQGKMIGTVFNKVKLSSYMLYDKEELSRRKQMQGLAPNVVHSLDSSHCMKTILACKNEGINSLSMVHDSYGTHAPDMNRLSILLRETFVEQYSQNVLDNFKEYLEVTYNVCLPDLPPCGGLDITQVLNSLYFFA